MLARGMDIELTARISSASPHSPGLVCDELTKRFQVISVSFTDGSVYGIHGRET